MAEQFLELWLRHFGVATAEAWGSVVLWRTVALVLATLVVLAFVFRKRIRALLLTPERRAHDAGVFRRADSILTEATLQDYFYCLNTNLMYYDRHSRALREYLSFAAKVSNEYLDQGVRKAAEDLRGRLDELTDFTGQHFFVHPPVQVGDSPRTFYLYPDLRWSEKPADRAFFEQHEHELYDLVDRANATYRCFRGAVKGAVFV